MAFLAFPHIRRDFLDISWPFSHVTDSFRCGNAGLCAALCRGAAAPILQISPFKRPDLLTSRFPASGMVEIKAMRAIFPRHTVFTKYFERFPVFVRITNRGIIPFLKAMKSRLHQIQDWPERAHEAKWRAATLAKNCDVSLRSLQRFFKKKTGKSPKVLLFEQRQEFAIEMSRNNSQIKVIASDLDYKYSCHFSRDFKKHWGIPLTEAKRNIPEN